MTLRDFCVSRSCRVVLRHARLWISNGHPTSEVYKYQQLTVGQARISTVRQASNQGVRGSNPIGRTFDPIIVTHVLEKMGENTRLTGHNDVRSEERRVGKECRYQWSAYQYKKKEK